MDEAVRGRKKGGSSNDGMDMSRKGKAAQVMRSNANQLQQGQVMKGNTNAARRPWAQPHPFCRDVNALAAQSRSPLGLSASAGIVRFGPHVCPQTGGGKPARLIC